MHIILVGLSHKTAPVEIREQLAVPESRLGEALARLRAYDGIKEGLLLSTCNRVEVYAVVDAVEPGYNSVQEFLAHPQLEARDRWQIVDSPAGPLRMLRPPFSVDGHTEAMGRVPRLGEHTDAILGELGFDPATIAGWRAVAIV